MKKNYGLFLVIMMLVFVKCVSASSYYYMNDEGYYMLCAEKGGCIEISQDEEKATFDLRNSIIQFNGVTYTYDSTKQEEYERNQAGKTRMYFYKDSSGRYVLCSTNEKRSCRTYTFDKLKDIATISADKIVVYSSKNSKEGTTYYLNQSMQNSSDSSDGSDSSNSQKTEKDTSVIINKPVLEPTTDTCTRLKEPLRFVGHIVLVFKIVIPIVLLALGAMDFFRAVTSSKEDDIKKSARSFAFRAISAVVIFFLPTLISVLFSFIDSWAGIRGDFNACQKCVLRVGECE